MVIEIKFDIAIDEHGAHDTPLLNPYELDMMLHHTKAQIEQHVQRCIGDLRCEEHGESARVCVSGVYSMETEQLEISYNIDACCQLFVLQAAAALNWGAPDPPDTYS